jgi:acyl CoA:acetate/3-ketoacid CoA transferase alpha subunit
MMPTLKPDTLNGQTVFRPVTTEGGVNHVNSGIVFPPGIKAGRPPIITAQELVEGAVRDLVTISDQTGDPVIKAQAVMFKRKIVQHQVSWLKRAADNEREVIRAWLKAHGFNNAAEAI